MNLSKSIDYLLENAGPVIQYRLHNEILRDLTKTGEENLLEQIYQTPYYKMVQSYIKPSGYIGIGMHSWDKFKDSPLQDGESAARLLSYYAIPKEQPIIKNFISAMRDDETLKQEFSYYYPETVRFDERNMGLHNGTGLMVLMYALQAMLGYGDDDYVKPFQDICIKSFTQLLLLASLDEIAVFKPHLKKKYNFPYIEPDTYYPCIYHLTTLAYTHLWRTPETTAMMTNAINHMNDILKSDGKYSIKYATKYNGAFWPLFRPFRSFKTDTPDVILYRRVLTELAMLGTDMHINILRQSAENIEEALAVDGILRFNYAKPADRQKYSSKWPTAYVDTALEPDYKKKTALDCDMTFWAIQFLYYVKGRNYLCSLK